MTAAEIYLSALRGWAEPKQHEQRAKTSPTRPKPQRLAGGCLLYRIPFRKVG